MTVLNYKGKILAHEDNFSQNMRQKYDAPFSDCHRVDLQQALAKRAQELGVNLVLNARVIRIDCGAHPGDEATVITAAGQGYTADLVLGADGLWSMCRSTLLGNHDPPQPTGDLAYRIVLNIEQIQDRNLREMVQQQSCRYWAGPDSQAVAFSLRGGTVYNVALVTPDDLDEGVSRSEGNIGELREIFSAWDPAYDSVPSHYESHHTNTTTQPDSTSLLRLDRRQMETDAPISSRLMDQRAV
jgi:salicylate hydroxylase